MLPTSRGTDSAALRWSAGRLGLLATMLSAWTTLVAAESAVPPRREYHERHMGVDVTISLYERDEKAANDAVRAAFARIAALNAIFSDYDADSETMRLCAAAPNVPHEVGPDLAFILVEARALSELTDGAFDVSIGPLTKLWRRARRRGELPTDADLAAARARSGWRLLEFDPAAPRVTLKQPEMHLDFGGIVKGYAAEEALKVLREAGIPSALVAVAGDIAAGAAPPDAVGWRIGLPSTAGPESPSTEFVHIAEQAISTSGDAFQFVDIAGRRYSHIVDPRTGLGVTDRVTVTVIAPRGHQADSLATAVSVLGVKRGLALIEATPGCAGRLVEHRELDSQGAAAIVHETQTFRRYSTVKPPR